ncbi:MAG: hypothetical protein H6819_10665 [Phycisphaerales bacterium]|nr:hypothetical protein [Phycisphaerales bacterium]MCB9854391.1 hypothetical protein [Phycisphaerales bacterium]MCB9863592.1 hypothetical protein [Phycisphaerales bacterium]
MRFMRRLATYSIASCVLTPLVACVRTPEVPTAVGAPLAVSATTSVTIGCADGPASLFVASPDLVPEGVEFDPVLCRFLLGSISSGNVIAVEDDGTFSALTSDDELAASTGLHLDGRRLLVCAQLASGAPGFGIYSADDGSRIALVDLTSVAGGGNHMINDCTVDGSGNAYVTDSMSTKIYRVTPAGDASLFLDDAAFATSGVSLNGIEYVPDDNVLVVAVTGLGKLFRIPLDDPASFSEVAIDASIAGDGVLLHPSGDLVVVGSATFSGIGTFTGVFALASNDGWQTASVNGVVTTSERGTTAALRGSDVYVTFAFIADFFTGTMVDRYPLLKIATEQGMSGVGIGL